MHGVKPTSPTDAVAMQHDIEYLRPGHFNAYKADLKAILNSGYTWEGLAMKFGLTTRIVLNLITATNPLLWALHPLTDFNKPYYKEDSQNEELVEVLQKRMDSWEILNN